MHEVIQGNTIVSADGHRTTLQPISDDTFWIDQGGDRVQAVRNGRLIKWDDGDVWVLSDRAAEAIGTMDQLLAAWEQAERASAETAQERAKRELDGERRRLDQERQNLDR